MEKLATGAGRKKQMNDQYDENRPLYGSRGIQIYLKLLQSNYPKVDVAALLHFAGMEPFQVTDESHFFSQKQINRFHEKIVELTGNANIAREAGRFASSPEAMGTLQGSIIGLLGPLRYYELIGTFANRFSKSSRYEAKRIGRNKVEIVVTPYPGTVEQPFQCWNRMGYWEAVSAVYGLEPPAIEHSNCLFTGGDCCRYQVSWKPSPSFLTRRIRNITGIILGLLCLWVTITSSLSVVVPTLLASLATLMTLNWLSRWFETRKLHSIIERMRGDSGKLVDQIEMNYEHSLLINEIGQALAKESEVDGLFEEVISILRNRLDYEGCLVFLFNSEKNALLYQAGFGPGQEITGKNEFPPIPFSESEGDRLFTGVFNARKPALFSSIDEIQEAQKGVAVQVVRETGMHSFIICPVVYEGENLGAIVIGNDRGARELLQRDINLVMGVASQIASRLHNMRLESHLRQTQKMEAVGILAGGVAHDFNNILTTILGYSEIILADLPAHDPLRDKVEDISLAGKKAAGLTRQLLAFSRKQVMEMQVTNLGTVVSDMGKMLGRLIGEDLTMELRNSADTGNVRADIGQLEQVLMNLVVNARDAMPAGGTLTIETSEIYLDREYALRHHGMREGQHAVLSVSDTGEGMDPEVQEKIFEPFYSTKKMGKGTGLGLSTVYGIVKQHSGHIYVYSEKGRGTTFKIYFPVVDDPVERKPVVSRTEMPPGNETILVVDDEESIRRVVVDTLEPLGYTLFGAASGEEALRLFRSSNRPIDLLLTDVIMPGMNGRELCEIVRREFSRVKTIYMSGYTDNVIVDKGILQPDVAFVNKPLQPVFLAGMVRSVLDGEEGIAEKKELSG